MSVNIKATLRKKIIILYELLILIEVPFLKRR